MRYLKLNKREITISIIAVLLMAGSLLYVRLIEPAINSYRTFKEEVFVEEEKLIRLNEITKKEHVITRDFLRYKNRIRTVDTSDDEMMAKVLEDIKNLIAKSGLHIINLKPLPVQKSTIGRNFR